MIDIKPIQDKVKQANDRINEYQGILESLAIQEGRAKTKLSSVTNPELVDKVFDETSKELDRIKKERAKANLKLKSYKATKSNAENELKQALEVNRVEKRVEYEKVISGNVSEVNEMVQQLRIKLTELNEVVHQAHQECAKAGDKSSRFTPTDKVILEGSLPMFIFRVDKSDVMKTTIQYWENNLRKKLDSQDVTYVV